MYSNHVTSVYMYFLGYFPQVFFILDESKEFDNEFWEKEMNIFQNFDGHDINVTLGTEELFNQDPRISWTKLLFLS